MTARRCDACRTMIPEGTPALVPALKGTGVRTWVWTCPACGCQNYDAPPEEPTPVTSPQLGTRTFTLGAVLSIITAIGACEFDELCELIDYLAGHAVIDFARPDVALCEAAPLALQFPQLSGINVPRWARDGGIPTMREWVRQVAVRTGLPAEVPVRPLGLDFSAARRTAVERIAYGGPPPAPTTGAERHRPAADRHPFGPPSAGNPRICAATACGLDIDHHVHRVEQLTPVQAELLDHVATAGSTAHEKWHTALRPGPTLLDLHHLMSLDLLETVDDVATVTNRGRSWLEAQQ